MWLTVTTAWRFLGLRMEERPPICGVAVNKLNKQPRTADEGGHKSWGLNEVLTTDLRGGVFLEEVSRSRKRNRDILLGTLNVRSLY